MPSHPAYAPEFRRQMVKLVRSGRSVEGLAREFEALSGTRYETRRSSADPEQLRRSLTWDQGAEMAQHAQLRIDTGLAAWFAREATAPVETSVSSHDRTNGMPIGELSVPKVAKLDLRTAN